MLCDWYVWFCCPSVHSAFKKKERITIADAFYEGDSYVCFFRCCCCWCCCRWAHADCRPIKKKMYIIDDYPTKSNIYSIDWYINICSSRSLCATHFIKSFTRIFKQRSQCQCFHAEQIVTKLKKESNNNNTSNRNK